MRLFMLLTILLNLVACNKQATNVLTVGAIAGPEADLLKTASQVASQRYGINLKIVEFNDYALPNAALQDRSIDVNVFQHLPYLRASGEAHHYDFAVLGKTFIFPIGLYSKKVKSIAQLPNNAQIAVPNDPSNEIRALLILEKAGLIKLGHEPASFSDNPLHRIVSNPKSIKIKELDAAQLPRALEDVDAAVINTNYATLAGLDLSHDTIYVEAKDSPYAMVIVARKDSQKKQQLEYLVKSLHSNDVIHRAKELFGNAAIPAWN